MACYCIGCIERMREDEEEDLQQLRMIMSKKDTVSYPTSPVRMETLDLIGPPHTRLPLVPPSSVPMSTCPSCETPSSITFTREEEGFPYGIAPHTVRLTAIVDKGRCAACSFEFTDYRAEEACDKAVQVYLASLATGAQT